MDAALITIGLAFIEGLALIISPCILPILPIILSGSLTGNKNKPLGIILGFIITFSILTLFIRSFIIVTHISPDIIRNTALLILLLLGIIMMSTYLTEKFLLLTQRLLSVGNKLLPNANKQSGFWHGVGFGALIGIVWTPCAGPIFAAVIVQVAIQETTLFSIFTLISFALGVGLPMLLIAYAGNRFITTLSIFKRNGDAFRKILGAAIIVSVVWLYFPSGLPTYNGYKASYLTGTELLNGLKKPYSAPPIEGIESWINSPPLQLSELKGKVVLIDFWTYSCINCIRTFPYLKEWYEKYHNKGLVIIGIHSPEFAFEKESYNVKAAVKHFDILYPVALDNKFETWRNFKNAYWPAHYLINKEGMIVYQHFGEGAYDITENNIRYLLGIRGHADTTYTIPAGGKQTPEIYLGYSRARQYGNLDPRIEDRASDYHYPISIPADTWVLNGRWAIHPDKITSSGVNAAIKLRFYARNVFAVLSNTGLPVSIEIKLNGRPVKTILITEPQLYPLIKLSEPQDGIVEIISKEPGLEMYTFTFGN